MKLNFIVNNKEEEINIDNIYLSPNNPRYTSLEEIGMNLFDLITKDSDLSPEEVMLTLLKYEGDFNDFLELIESIKNIGFNNRNDPIILLKNNLGNYICAEGNRRILVLKLVSKKCKFPSNFLDSTDPIIDNIDDPYFDNDSEKNIRSSRNKNIQKIIETIEHIWSENRDIEVNIKLLAKEDEDDIWEIIYDKHLTGEKPGSKKWSRGKYYADLICLLPDGISEDSSEKIKNFLRMKLKRTISNVISDFQNAQFVYKIFEYGPDEKKKEEEILDSMKKKQVSALGPNFSLKKIKEIAISSLYIKKEEISSYFSYSYNENNKIEINKENKISEEKMFKFIYRNSLIKKIITTRSIRDIYIDKFELDVMTLFSLDITIDRVYKNDVNFLELGNNYLDEMIQKCKDEFFKSHDEKIKRKITGIEKIKELKNNADLLVKELRGDKDVKDRMTIFNVLLRQIMHNEKKEFYHAISSTIRSFYDLLFCFSFLSLYKNNDDLFQSFKENISNFMNKNIKNCRNLESGKNIYSFEDIQLENFLKEDKEKNEIIIFIKKNWNSDYKYLFCQIIHAPYVILQDEFFQNDLEKLNNWINITKEIINLLDWEKIMVVNDYINQE